TAARTTSRTKRGVIAVCPRGYASSKCLEPPSSSPPRFDPTDRTAPVANVAVRAEAALAAPSAPCRIRDRTPQGEVAHAQSARESPQQAYALVPQPVSVQ